MNILAILRDAAAIPNDPKIRDEVALLANELCSSGSYDCPEAALAAIDQALRAELVSIVQTMPISRETPPDLQLIALQALTNLRGALFHARTSDKRMLN